MKKMLKIAIAAYDKWVTECGAREPTLGRTKTCPLPGFFNEVLLYFFETQGWVLGRDYVLEGYKKPDWGEDIGNGTYTGLLGALENGSIDLISPGFAWTVQRNRTFLFTIPMIYISHGFVYSRKTDQIGDGFLAMLQLFKIDLWIAIFSIIMMLAVVTSFVSFSAHGIRKGFRKERFRNELQTTFWRILRFMAHQVVDDSRIQNSSLLRFLTLLLGLLALFVAALYQGGLLSSLLAVRQQVPFRSTKELAPLVFKGDYKMVLDPRYSYYLTVMASLSPLFSEMKKAFVKNPPKFVSGLIAWKASLMQNLKLVLPVEEFGAHFITRKQCVLQFQPDEDFEAEKYFLLRRDMKWLKDLLDKFAHKERPFIRAAVDRYKRDKKHHECHAYGHRPLSMKNLSGIYAFCFMLCFLGLLSFGAEVLLDFWREKKKTSMHKSEISPFSQQEMTVREWRQLFYQREQALGESADLYLDSLKQLVTKCDFRHAAAEEILCDKFINGLRDNELRQKLLKSDAHLNVQALLTIY